MLEGEQSRQDADTVKDLEKLIQKHTKEKLPPGMTPALLAKLVMRIMKKPEGHEDVLELSGDVVQELGIGGDLKNLPAGVIDSIVEKFAGKTTADAQQLVPEVIALLQEDGVKSLRKAVFGPPIRKTGPQVGRNDPCTCGSGKKFKKCCGGKH